MGELVEIPETRNQSKPSKLVETKNSWKLVETSWKPVETWKLMETSSWKPHRNLMETSSKLDGN